MFGGLPRQTRPSLREAGMLISDVDGESQSKGATAQHQMIKPTLRVALQFRKAKRATVSPQAEDYEW